MLKTGIFIDYCDLHTPIKDGTNASGCIAFSHPLAWTRAFQFHNIAINVIKYRSALETFNRHAGQMCISAITLAELFHGAEKSAKPDRNLRQVEDFVSWLDVLEYGSTAGDIRAALERKGTPIGVNDLHIVARARSEGLTLVTNNVREFEWVDALRLENWISQPSNSTNC